MTLETCFSRSILQGGLLMPCVTACVQAILEAGRRSLDSGNKAIRIIYPSATSIEPSALE